MPILTPASDGSGAFEQLWSQAGFAQVVYPPNSFPVPLPTAVGAGSNWLSGLIFPDGYRNVTVGVTSTQAGALVFAFYLDLAGTVVRTTNIGSGALSTPIVAATPLIVDFTGMSPFLSMTVQITNTSGSLATISGFQLILSAG